MSAHSRYWITRYALFVTTLLLVFSLASQSEAVFVYAPEDGKGNVDIGPWRDKSGISIGENAETSGNYGISFGAETKASGEYSNAFGYDAVSSGRYSNSIGYEAEATNGYSTAIGYRAKASGIDSVSVGTNAQASGTNSIAIGSHHSSFNENDFTRAQAMHSIAIGYKAQTIHTDEIEATESIAVGDQAVAGAQGSSSLGAHASTEGSFSTAVGYNAVAYKEDATALGYNAGAGTAGSVALGADSYANRTTSKDDVYIPTGASRDAIIDTVAGSKGVASFGYITEDRGVVYTRQLTGVAAGAADTDAVNVAQLKGLGEAVANVIGGGVSFDGDTGGVTVDGNPYDSLVDAIEKLGSSGSVGNGVNEGNNIHVETDLTSGQQTVHLKDNIELESVTLNTAQTIHEGGKHAATTGHVHSLGSAVAGLFGGDFAVQTDGSISGGVFSVNGETFTTINDALNYLAGGWTFEPVDNSAQAGAEGGTGSAAETTPPQSSIILPGETLTVNAGDDIDITQNADKEYTISVAPDLRKEIEEGYTAADETLKVNITEAYKQADSELKADITDAYTKADENLEADITKAYTEADATLETKITEAYKAVDAELQAGIDKNTGTIKTIGDVLGGEANGYKAPSFNTVTTNSLKMGDYTVSATDGGLDMGRAKLTNIARGDVSAGSTDAVTGGQLWDTYQRMGAMENNIYREMDDLREDVNVVGAHAAALSGLHPIQYNPYEPTTLSAAVGAYRDEYAVAVGVFHYTRENVMFNLGASLCSDGDVMGRAGVSFALGKSSDKKPRLASTMGGLQKQVLDMQTKLDSLEEKNARNEEIIKQNAEIMAQNEKLIRELTKRLEAKN